MRTFRKMTLLDSSLIHFSLSWIHAKICFIAGAGFFTDAQVHHTFTPPWDTLKSSPIAMTYSLLALLSRCWGTCMEMKMVEQTSLPPSSLVHSHVVLAGDLSSWQSTGLKVATPIGNLVGQLVFGYLADILGRKRMCEWSTSCLPDFFPNYST